MKFKKNKYSSKLVYANIYKLTKLGEYHIVSNFGVLNNDTIELKEEDALLIRVNNNADDIIQSFIKVSKIDDKFIYTTDERIDTYPFVYNRAYVDINSIKSCNEKNKEMIMTKE